METAKQVLNFLEVDSVNQLISEMTEVNSILGCKSNSKRIKKGVHSLIKDVYTGRYFTWYYKQLEENWEENTKSRCI